MIDRRTISKVTSMLLTGILASSILILPIGAQSPSPAAKPVGVAGAPSRNRSFELPRKVQAYYTAVWGVDELGVKAVESGEIIRFTWRVIDPDLAKTVHDKDIEPSLIDPQAGVKLVVPALENVGSLRQMSTPIAGKSYWMAFSNPGRMVKPGHRVIVQVGAFHADGLIVQ
jgi:hypothetical protein